MIPIYVSCKGIARQALNDAARSRKDLQGCAGSLRDDGRSHPVRDLFFPAPRSDC